MCFENRRVRALSRTASPLSCQKRRCSFQWMWIIATIGLFAVLFGDTAAAGKHTQEASRPNAAFQTSSALLVLLARESCSAKKKLPPPPPTPKQNR